MDYEDITITAFNFGFSIKKFS